MSTLKDRELINSISILQDNDNKLVIIETLKNIKKAVEMIENTAKIVLRAFDARCKPVIMADESGENDACDAKGGVSLEGALV